MAKYFSVKMIFMRLLMEIGLVTEKLLALFRKYGNVKSVEA